jgi:hypothetical protein
MPCSKKLWYQDRTNIAGAAGNYNSSELRIQLAYQPYSLISVRFV